MKINAALIQFMPALHTADNLNKMMEVIHSLHEDELAVMPEGCLSGYDHDLSFLSEQKAVEIEEAILKLKDLAAKKKVHLLFGTLFFKEAKWYNAGIYLSPDGAMQIYKKVNLAWHERGILKPGSKLECFLIQTNSGSFLASIQLCREIRFPEQWTALAEDGSQIFFYLTNTINPDAKAVWDAHLVSRAAENQRFVLSSNVAHHEQGCSTLAIDPEGKIIGAIPSADEAIVRVEIDLSRNSSWYLDQRRKDLMDCRERLQKEVNMGG